MYCHRLKCFSLIVKYTEHRDHIVFLEINVLALLRSGCVCRDTTKRCVSFVILKCEENIASPTCLRGLWEVYEMTCVDLFSEYFLNVSHDCSCEQKIERVTAPREAPFPGWVSKESWGIETAKALTPPWGHVCGFVLLPRFHGGGYPVRYRCAWLPVHCNRVELKMTGSKPH